MIVHGRTENRQNRPMSLKWAPTRRSFSNDTTVSAE
jgi:hypothetical protein